MADGQIARQAIAMEEGLTAYRGHGIWNRQVTSEVFATLESLFTNGGH